MCSHFKQALYVLPLIVSKALASDSFDDFATLSSNQIFSVARMDQSIQDVPGAVTIITAEQIERLGIKSIPEALRLVPGFFVDYSSPFTYVNRGPNFPTPRRLQVLVDGISEVYPLVGIVRWETLPIPIERIARIEVVRSQSSASYGANAFYGTVNIISKHPNDTLGTNLQVSGMEKGGSAYARHSSEFGSTSVLVDYKKSKYDGFDKYYDSDEKRDDDMDVDTISVMTRTKRENKTVKFSINGAHGDFEHGVSAGEYAITYPKPILDTSLVSGSFQADYDTHTVKLEAFRYDRDWDFNWDLCGPQFFFYPGLGDLYRDNPNLVLAALNGYPLPPATPKQLSTLSVLFSGIQSDPNSFETVCGTQDTSYTTVTQMATLSDIWLVTDSLRISTSLQFEYRSIDSRSFGNGKTTLEKSKFITNAEYILGDRFTFNAGFMAESLNYNLPDPELSPRVGVNYHVNEFNTIKMVYSLGKRLVDGIEILDYNQIVFYLDREIYGTKVSSAFLNYFPLLEDKDFVERIESRELIYLFHSQETEFEARYFEEDLSNINNYQDASGSPITAYLRKGAELIARRNFGLYDVRISGSYISSESETQVDWDDYDAYGGSAYLSRMFENDIEAGLSYYGTSSIRGYSSYDRIDFRLAKGFTFSDSNMILAGVISHNRSSYKRAIDYGGVLDGGERSQQNEIRVDVSLSF